MLARLGKLENPLGDPGLEHAALIAKSEGDARRFEREADDPRRLGIEPLTAQERGDGYGALPCSAWLQAGARLVSQPPAPGRAAVGDVISMRRFLWKS